MLDWPEFADRTPPVIEAAAKRKTQMFHPDSGESPDREEFIAVQKAKDALLNEGN